MEKLSGINCVLSTDSMCKKVTFLRKYYGFVGSFPREKLGGGL